MTPIGIIVALVAVVVSMTLDHGQVTDLIKIPAIILVLGGSLGATVVGFDKRRLRAVPKATKLVMLPGDPPDMKGTIDTLLTMAREVRQNPLALEQLETDDAFLKMGIQVITSTSDPERVHELLGAEVVGLRTRHTTSIKFFSDMAGYSPTFGILGTVIGLIGVLGQLTQPGKLGPAIASAFAATLWGVLLANAVWLPISNRLRRLSDEEITYREMVIEGLLTMQLNVSSMDLKDRLYAFLPPSERAEEAVAPRDAPDRRRGGRMSQPQNTLLGSAPRRTSRVGRGGSLGTARHEPGTVAVDLRRHDHPAPRPLHRPVRPLEDQPSQIPAVPTIGEPCEARRLLGGTRIDLRSQPRTGSVVGVLGPSPSDRAGPVPCAGAEGLLGDVTLTIDASGLVEGLVADSTFFLTDSAQLSPLGDEIVDTSGHVLDSYPNNVDVAGYTDDQAITGGPYADNWALSAARSSTVVERLTTVDGVDPERVVAIGYGQYHPVVPNTSPTAEAENRRVNIVVSRESTPGSSAAQ